uniref:Uncharacterized protein n=1 Tax=Oryza glumipatula TaxID=40148 RepID=A0A0D9ZYH4_9ORYZ
MAELLSALLPALLKKDGESLATEFSFIGGIERRRSELYTLLLAINQVIYDAEEQASKKPAVKSWIAKLKKAACDADDALDELHYEVLRSKALRRGHKINSGVRAFLSPHYNPLLVKYKIGKRLQQIVEQINKLVLQMDQFGLLDCSMPVDERMQTYSYIDEQNVIGRDKESNEIIHILLSAKSNELLILPIVGIGGLGKTTLAQFVFNRVKVKAHFQKHIWVCVSEEFNVPDIVKRIIDTAIGNDCGLKNDNLELLQQRLREELSQKRYLLVLDDVWNEDEQKWEALKTLLGSCGMGSAMVVTTRNLNVALIMGTVHPFDLKSLSPEHSWKLFHREMFDRDVVESTELVEIGQKIVKKCSGVPLAINNIGGLMRRKHDARDWLAILDSNTWDEENNILPALWLSYKHLPSYMKQCFVFCAVFPKDYEICKDRLIHLWVSNGFIPSKETSDIEETGNHVFLELVSRSFLQKVKTGFLFSMEKYRYRSSDVTMCKMHDLAMSISRYECFALLDLAEIKKIPENFLKYLEFKKSPCRVIGFNIDGDLRLSVEPAFMKHLRYLDLSGSGIEELPEATSALYNLQTLMLNNCVVLNKLPESMKYMASLRHVYLDRCSRLQSMPVGLGHLTGCGIEELKYLKLGGKLNIFNLIQELAFCWSTSEIADLQVHPAEDGQLYRAEDFDVLHALKPPNGLKVLKLRYYMGIEYPTWIEDGVTLQNIVKLSLTNSINCIKLPPVWHLPLLEVLRLKGMESFKYLCSSYSRDKECGHNLVAFPKLKLLSLVNMESLENWQEHGVEQVMPITFPALDAMEIFDCPKLTTLPNVPMLRSLSVVGNKILLGIATNITNLSYLYLRASRGRSWRLRTLCYGYIDEFLGSIDAKEHLLADQFLSWGSLTKLHLEGFYTLAPEDTQNRSSPMMSVQNLDLTSCDCFIQYDKMQSSVWFWKSFVCLEHLTLEYCDTLSFWPEEELQCLTSLKKLIIVNCKNFTGMPPAKLSLKPSAGCPGVKTLPEGLQQRLHSLETFMVEDCPALARRCKRGGEYWDKVKDIPDLDVTCEQRSAWRDAARAIIPKCAEAWFRRASSSRQPDN